VETRTKEEDLSVYATDNWLLGAVKGTIIATVKVTAYRRYDVKGNDGKTVVAHYEDSDSVTLTLEGKLRNNGASSYDATNGPIQLKQIFSLMQDGDTSITASGSGTSSSWTRSSTRDASWNYAPDPVFSQGLFTTLTASYGQIQPGSTTKIHYEIPGDGVANWFSCVFAVTGTVTTTEKDQDGKSSSPITMPISSADCNFATTRISDVVGDWRDHAGDSEKLAGDDMSYQDTHFTCSRKVAHAYTKAGDRDTFTVLGNLEIQCDLAADPRIRGILVNQALGQISFSKNPDIDYCALPMNAVAGKQCVVQVFFPNGLAAGTAGAVTVEVRKDGQQLAQLSTFEVDAERNQLIFDPGDTSDWEAGTYTFSAMLGTGVKSTVETRFQKQMDVRILAIPVKANYGGGLIATPANNWQSADSFMRAVYPLSRKNMKWKIGATLDASDERYNLSTEKGLTALWTLLNEQQSCFLKYDLIVGVIDSLIPLGAGGQASGFTCGKPSTIAVSSLPIFPKTIAHEVGHVYLLGDEYNNGSFNTDVNWPPFGYVGTDFFDAKKHVLANNLDIDPGPGDGSLSGSLISAKLFPWEYRGRGPLPDLQCFMGGGKAALSTFWISPTVWSHLYDKLSAEVQSSDTKAPGVSAAGALASGNGDTRMVDASGWISSSGEVTLDKPWRSYMTSEPFAVAIGGLYTIAAVDATGKPLALQTFAPSFLALSDPPFALDPAPFSAAVPFPDGTVKFQIASPAGLANILKEVPVCANSPTVAITSPAAGSVCPGPTSIAWTASHPDGATLSYDVEYSHDGQDWTVIGWRLSQTEFSKDFGTLAGSDHALIRVIACDGVNATVATSEPFRVPYKPPQVFIEEPLQSSQGLVLNGRGYDLTDGWIYETSQLSWTSDSDAALGSGARVLLNDLSPGPHTFTLTATNSHGLSASQSVVATS
jgi:hypothetical protein